MPKHVIYLASSRSLYCTHRWTCIFQTTDVADRPRECPNNAMYKRSVVDGLIRASLGAKADRVKDEELDGYVSQLLADEASAKQSKYKELGLSAFQEQGERKLRPNTAFLRNVMKQTEGQNTALREARRSETPGGSNVSFSSRRGPLNSDRPSSSSGSYSDFDARSRDRPCGRNEGRDNQDAERGSPLGRRTPRLSSPVRRKLGHSLGEAAIRRRSPTSNKADLPDEERGRLWPKGSSSRRSN